MKLKKNELPLVDPMYSTYQFQGVATAILRNNPSIRNWYLNHAIILNCTRRFLNGFTSPNLQIVDSSWDDCPYLEKRRITMQFLDGHIHYVIRNLINAGYYVYFYGVDDYYVEGKSWYHERHFSHDGCICGYNQEDKTYCIYAYDKDWVYRKFWTTQKSFDAGKKAMFKTGVFGELCAIKPTEEEIVFSSETALDKITEYLDSTLEKYPETSDDTAYGIVVHDYVAKYLDKLYDGSIPYERMDRRVFRIIWEHKKVMYERIKLIESELSLDTEISEAYKNVVKEADNCRMLYASHHMKRRDVSLPIIQKKLLSIKAREQELLEELLRKAKGIETK